MCCGSEEHFQQCRGQLMAGGAATRQQMGRSVGRSPQAISTQPGHAEQPSVSSKMHQTAERLCLSLQHKPFITPVGFRECLFSKVF